MKKSLFTKVLSFFIVAGALLSGTVSNNAVEKTNNDIKFETVDDLGRGELDLKSKNTVVGDAEVTAVSDTKAQYGLDADGNYRIRFVTALTGDVHTLSYTLFKDGVEYGSYYVTTIYKSVVSGEKTLYYDGTDFVSEATEATNDYYFACGSIVLGPSYYATKFTASLTLTKSDETTITSTPREASVNELVNYQFADKCVADFETKNQISGFTAPWGSTISYSEDIKASGNGAMKMTLHNQYSIMEINGEGLGVDSLENYDGFNLKFYVSDTTDTNVYSDTTYFRFVLVYKDGTSTSISSVDVKEANTWVDINLPLKTYNQYNLKDGKFQFSLAKYVNNTITATGGYEGVEVYIDEIYMESLKVRGRSTINVPYNQSLGPNLYTQASTSETGYTDVGVARYGMAHGTYDNYTMYNKNNLGVEQSATESGLASNMQYIAAKTDNMITVIEATEHCYAKFVDNTNCSVYMWGNAYIRKYTAESNSWTQLSYKQGTDNVLVPYMKCEYQELQAGDKLVLEIYNQSGGNRYITNPSGISIAPLVDYEASSTSIENAKEKLLDGNHSFDGNKAIYPLINGSQDENMSIGLSDGTNSYTPLAGSENGWCGFKNDYYGNTHVIIHTSLKATIFSYSYTATESGYVFIDQALSNWYSGTASMVLTIGDEVISSCEFEHADGKINDLDIATYLEKGEILKVQFTALTTNAEKGSHFVFKNLNVSFAISSEFELPAGYDSLVDYINA